MDQISPPIRILLAAVLVGAVAWFAFLRPGEDPVAPTPAVDTAAAPTTAYGKAVVDAQEAAAATDAASAVSAAGGTGATGATGTVVAPVTSPVPNSAAPATAPKAKAPPSEEAGLPASVAKAVADKKVLVMLFWNRNAIDDRAVRRELRDINRHKGKVKVHVASIGDVARYAAITRGVNLEQSPTVVVSKGTTADALVGYVDAGTIDQAVSDLLRSK